MSVKSYLFAMGMLAALGSPAGAAVITFDNLSGSGLLADGYAGVNWGGIWNYYEDTQFPYTPASSPERIYATFGTVLPSFTFQNTVSFEGFYISGVAAETGPVSFDLYLGGFLVGTSNGSVLPSDVPTFLASAYSGKIDTVQINGTSDYYVVDNVTYGMSSVPLPASAPLFGAALMVLGAAGYGMKRKKAAASA